ncbi:hypothetical protein SAMN05445060_0412 [Williamsia sterculiae]|uniref:Uncharacterized protein n=1 Tax=Williamsia sterculiae TaxID=1344003 RepID=A0A1N7CWN4_9NOCA|nr:hypothetical protein SAMN05445060_0412 [Williamsia sterculiae]
MPLPPHDRPQQNRPDRPTGLAIAFELWVVVVVAQWVAFVAQLPDLRATSREVAQRVNDDTAATARDGAAQVHISDTVLLVAMIIVGLVTTAVVLGAAWLGRSGYNWARLVSIFFAVYVLVDTVFRFFSDARTSWAMIPIVIGGVAALGALYTAALRDSDAYCRAMSGYRKQQKSGWAPSSQWPPSPNWPSQQPPPYQQQPPPYQQQPPSYPPGRHDSDDPDDKDRR